MMHERHYCFLVHESFDVILKLCQANILCPGRILSICRCYPLRYGSELFNLLAALTLYVIMWKLIHLTFWSILMHVRYMTGYFKPFHCSIDAHFEYKNGSNNQSGSIQNSPVWLKIINFSRHPQILHWPKFRNSNRNLIHHHFSPEELKPTPIQKKSRKQLVRDEDKDEKYWDKVRPLWTLTVYFRPWPSTFNLNYLHNINFSDGKIIKPRNVSAKRDDHVKIKFQCGHHFKKKIMPC